MSCSVSLSVPLAVRLRTAPPYQTRYNIVTPRSVAGKMPQLRLRLGKYLLYIRDCRAWLTGKTVRRACVVPIRISRSRVTETIDANRKHEYVGEICY